MKAYISGPMSGMPKLNRAAFEGAAAELRAAGLEVISPVELDKEEGFALEGQQTPQQYWQFLARDIKTIGLSEAGMMFMLDGWWNSKGARLEVFQALLLGIVVFEFGTLRPLNPDKVMAILTMSIKEEL